MRSIFSFSVILAVFFSALTPVFAQLGRVNARDEATSKFSDRSAKQSVFSDAGAYSDGAGVYLRWEMAAEHLNVGFEVFRMDALGTKSVSDGLIPGNMFQIGALPRFGQIYEFFDTAGEIGGMYFVEAISTSGDRVRSSVVSAQYVTDLKGASGRSSGELARQKSESAGHIMKGELSLPDDLVAEVKAAGLSANLDTHRWVISQPGVRIGVRADGLYRVTRSALEAAGFNVNADPNQWQLYLEGVQLPIIVGPNADYIEFFGRGIDRVESDTQAYFLINGNTAGKRMSPLVARPSSGTAVQQNYDQSFFLKERITYNGNVLNGDAENWWGRVVGGAQTTLNFNLTGIDHNSPTADLHIRFFGFSAGNHQVQMTLNGHQLPIATGNAQTAFGIVTQVPTSVLIEGQNSLQMASVDPGPPADFNLFDSIEVGYKRRFVPNQGRVSFYTLNHRKARLEGFATASVRVFDITDEKDVRRVTNLSVEPQGPTFDVELPGGRGRKFFAVEDSALLSPHFIRPFDTALLGEPTLGADMVIIAYRAWMAEAETWANYRRNQGLTVKVVDVDEIYNEFNYGVLSADSIKSFLHYAYDNWQVRPQYVFLMGDSTYDSRDYFNIGFFNFVPTRIINTIFTETGSDEFLADFNNDGLAEMAVGRVAARTPQIITRVFGKMLNWEQNLSDPFSRGALFAHDFPDGYDFEGMNNRLRNKLPQTMPVTMVHRGQPNAQAAVVGAINSGKYIVNYAGHGTAGAWAATSFFANSTVSQLNNVNNESVFTMLTCLNGYFILPTTNSLSENLVHYANGGAVAAWASTGLTTPDVQELMATRFYEKLGLGSIQRIGDLVRDAKTVIPGGMDVRLSWVLLSDPTMKVNNGPPPVMETNREKASR
jgi:hypothetical protein